MNGQTAIALASVGLGVLTSLLVLAYHMGRLSVRVESLELWRTEMRAEMGDRFIHIENLIRGVTT